ncbi:MAG: hypothetical protein IH614_13775, partial [Desulfuromonadales bacterium]|nr:hypothetical protein [Desulfuromonadales bacterium]
MKNPLLSKTLWVNLLGIAALLGQAKYGFVVSPEDQAVALAAVNLLLRLVTRESLDWSKVKPAGVGMMMLLLLPLLPVMSGCSLLRAAEERPVLTELAVRAATGRVLEERPKWVEPTERITADAIRLLQGDDPVGLADLESYVLGQIPWQRLTPEETEILRVLVRAVREEIEGYLDRQGVT